MQYWVVGAMFSGSDDQLSSFSLRGYWYCWDPSRNAEIPSAVKSRFLQIRAKDRIAVKRLLGVGSAEIEVRALGIVKDVDQVEWRVYVDWIVPSMARRVPHHGCAASLHGPFDIEEAWTQSVFAI